MPAATQTNRLVRREAPAREYVPPPRRDVVYQLATDGPAEFVRIAKREFERLIALGYVEAGRKRSQHANQLVRTLWPPDC